MALCSKCAFYSEEIDETGRNFNDIGNENEHFCTMYRDTIPDGVFNGEKDCDFYEQKTEQE